MCKEAERQEEKKNERREGKKENINCQRLVYINIETYNLPSVIKGPGRMCFSFNKKVNA